MAVLLTRRRGKGQENLGAEARAHADQAVELSAQQPAQHIMALWRRAAVRCRQGDQPGAMDDCRAALQSIEEIRARLVPLDFMKQGFSLQHQGVYSR